MKDVGKNCILQASGKARLGQFDRDSLFVFAVGFISTGIYEAFLTAVANGFFGLFIDSIDCVVSEAALKAFVVYGLLGGFVALLVKRFVDRFRFNFLSRELWLVFSIPQVAFALAGFAVTMSNYAQGVSFNIADILDVVPWCLEFCAALLLSFLMLIPIALFRLTRVKINSTDLQKPLIVGGP